MLGLNIVSLESNADIWCVFEGGGVLCPASAFAEVAFLGEAEIGNSPFCIIIDTFVAVLCDIFPCCIIIDIISASVFPDTLSGFSLLKLCI